MVCFFFGGHVYLADQVREFILLNMNFISFVCFNSGNIAKI